MRKNFIAMLAVPFFLFAEDSKEVNGTVYARLGSMKSTDFVATNVNNQIDYGSVNSLVEYKLKEHVTNYVDSATGETNTIATTKWVDGHGYLTEESDPEWRWWRFSSYGLFGSGAKATYVVNQGMHNYLAFGRNAEVSSYYPENSAAAFGDSAKAYADGAASFGANAIAAGSFSTAIGYGSMASNQNTTSVGPNTKAYGFEATAVGHNAQAGTLEGVQSTLYKNATAIGSSAKASRAYSTAIGAAAESTESGAVAIGSGARAKHEGSVVVANDDKYESKGSDTLCFFQGDSSKVYFGTNTLASMTSGIDEDTVQDIVTNYTYDTEWQEAYYVVDNAYFLRDAGFSGVYPLGRVFYHVRNDAKYEEMYEGMGFYVWFITVDMYVENPSAFPEEYLDILNVENPTKPVTQRALFTVTGDGSSPNWNDPNAVYLRTYNSFSSLPPDGLRLWIMFDDDVDLSVRRLRRNALGFVFKDDVDFVTQSERAKAELEAFLAYHKALQVAETNTVKVVEKYRDLHYDNTLQVTWTNVVDNGHIYYITVTNTDVSVVQ